MFKSLSRNKGRKNNGEESNQTLCVVASIMFTSEIAISSYLSHYMLYLAW